MTQPFYFTVPSDTLKASLAQRLGYEIVSASWLVASVAGGLWVEEEAAEQQAEQSETTGVMLAEGHEYEEVDGTPFQFELAGGIVLSAAVDGNAVLLHGANYATAPYPLNADDRATLALHVQARGERSSTRLCFLTPVVLSGGQPATEQATASPSYVQMQDRLEHLSTELRHLRQAEQALTEALDEKSTHLTTVVRALIAEGERRQAVWQAEADAKREEVLAFRKRPLTTWVPRPRDYDDLDWADVPKSQQAA